MNAVTLTNDINTAVAALNLVQQIIAGGAPVAAQIKAALQSNNASADTAILDAIIADAAAGEAQAKADLAADQAAGG